MLVIVPQFNPIFLSYFLFFYEMVGGGVMWGERMERDKTKKKKSLSRHN